MRRIAGWQDIQLVLDGLEREVVLRAVRSPPRPRVQAAVIFARVNGAGKVELCWQPPTGAARVLDTEP